MSHLLTRLLPTECGCYRARAELPSVEFPVGDVRAENNSFEGPRKKSFHRARQWSVSGRPKHSTATRGASMPNLEIMWTKVDEAPALATYSELPIVEAFVGTAGVSVKLKDISLAGRIIANFPEKLTPCATDQRRTHRTWRTHACGPKPTSSSCPISLPRSRSSRPRLRNFKARATTFRTIRIIRRRKPRKRSRARYAKMFGSVVNPILREGNSDRRAAGAVKQYARNNPHKMGAWSSNSQIACSLHVGRRLLRLGNFDHRSRRRPTPASSWSAPTAPSRC